LNKDGKPVWEPGLKAEVTSRRQHPVKKKKDEAQEAPVVCDLKLTIKLAPDARAHWLERALEAIPKGRCKPQDVFDIITHRKFVSGIPDDLGQKMLRQVKESLMFFSEKQQLNIARCKLVKEFKPVDPSKRRRRHDGDDDDSDMDRSSDEDVGLGRRQFSEVDTGREPERRPESTRQDEDAASDDQAESEKLEDDRPDLSTEERTRIERDFAERERERQLQREDELKSLENDRKAHEEREKQRKAKIGNAFLLGDDDEDEPPQPGTRLPMVEKKADERLRSIETEGLAYSLKSSGSDATGATASGAIQTMGGDNIVNEAQKLLVQGAGVFFGGGKKESPPRRNKSNSRSRERRRSRSRSRRRGGRSRSRSGRRPKEDRRRARTYDSLRSPTPDGHLRGQMRAARKAKMMAQMMKQGNVPRVA